jgi:hypothetical protein
MTAANALNCNAVDSVIGNDPEHMYASGQALENDATIFYLATSLLVRVVDAAPAYYIATIDISDVWEAIDLTLPSASESSEATRLKVN